MPIEWDEIEHAATQMFNIWTSGGDLVFAKECWSHLAAAELTCDDGVVFRTQACLRLVALRLICGEFCAAKWEENAETNIVDLVEDLKIDPLALGLLASPHLDHGGVLFEDEYELREEALTVAVNAVRSETFACIRRAYGGQTGLYQRMSRIAGNEDIDQEDDFDLNGGNLAAFDFAERGER